MQPVSSATHVTSANLINLAVVVGYLLMIVGVGTYFALRRKSASQFMLADQSMPGWAVGLSMFGSYISSISFLGNPATTFKGNWMFAGFTLMTPVGLLVGTRVFMKFYRRGGAVSAYSHLEARFGPWARTYAVFTFLVLQMARMGTILFLLSQAVLPLLGGTSNDLWLARLIIVAVGLLITLYTLFGGIEAVVWTGVIQAFVLILGPILCVATLLWKMPGGVALAAGGEVALDVALVDAPVAQVFEDRVEDHEPEYRRGQVPRVRPEAEFFMRRAGRDDLARAARHFDQQRGDDDERAEEEHDALEDAGPDDRFDPAEERVEHDQHAHDDDDRARGPRRVRRAAARAHQRHDRL